MRWVRPRVDPVPFLGGDDARQQIGGDDPLGGLVVAIDGEGDALMQEALLAGLLPAHQFLQRQAGEARIQGHIGRPGPAVGREHFVIGRAQLILRIRRIAARPRRPRRSGRRFGATQILGIGQNFLLHARQVWRCGGRGQGRRRLKGGLLERERMARPSPPAPGTADARDVGGGWGFGQGKLFTIRGCIPGP